MVLAIQSKTTYKRTTKNAWTIIIVAGGLRQVAIHHVFIKTSYYIIYPCYIFYFIIHVFTTKFEIRV